MRHPPLKAALPMDNKEPSITKDTYRRRILLLQNHVFPVVGKRQISELRVSDVNCAVYPNNKT